MGSMSIWHWVVVLLVIVLLFGAKKIPELAKGIGSGIKTFKKELEEDDKSAEQTSTQGSAVNSSFDKKANSPQEQKSHVELIEAEVVGNTYNAQQKDSLKTEKS